MKQEPLGAAVKHWLWKGWLPTGSVVIAEGMSGIGKSLFLVDVCARVTSGRAFADGTPHPTGSPTDVIYITAEDDPTTILGPRFAAAGGDINRIAAFPEARFPDELGDLEGEITRRGAKLVVIDPLFNHIEEINPNHDTEIRTQIMRPLAEIANTTDSVILLVRHFNKGSGVSVTMRGSGSYGGLSGAARAVITAVEEPHEDPGERTGRTIIGVTNSNYGPHPSPLVYSIEERCPARDPVLDAMLRTMPDAPTSYPHDYTIPTVKTHGVSAMSVEVAQMKLENRRAARGTETRRKPSVDALLLLLDGMGKVPAKDIYAAMAEQGFGETASQTARDAIGAKYGKDGNSGPWVWWLPDTSPAPAHVMKPPTDPSSSPSSVQEPETTPFFQSGLPMKPKNGVGRPASIVIRVEEGEEGEEGVSMVGGVGGDDADGVHHQRPVEIWQDPVTKIEYRRYVDEEKVH